MKFKNNENPDWTSTEKVHDAHRHKIGLNLVSSVYSACYAFLYDGLTELLRFIYIFKKRKQLICKQHRDLRKRINFICYKKSV